MKPEQVAEQFDMPGHLVSMRSIGSGNVNDTYLAIFRTHFSEQRIIIQRINKRVFTHPDWIMENFRTLTDHCHRQLLSESNAADRIWQLPRIIPFRNGQDYFQDTNGECWRGLTLIASATAYDVVQSTEHAFEVGTVLGQFHRLTSGLDSHVMHDTLPGFHETPQYLSSYDDVLEHSAIKERIAVSKELQILERFIADRRDNAHILDNAIHSGELTQRLIHGDPKVGNIMIDDETGKGTAIIDLDTVKPGLIHYDFGDALRSLCNKAGEEAEDPAKVEFDLELCEAFVKGYMAFAKTFLTENDRKYLYDAIHLITFELGLRFFQDYLQGDVYFKTKSPGQNLHRTKIQFRLCESIETRKRQIQHILNQAMDICDS